MGLYRFDVTQGVLRVFGGQADVRAGDRVVRLGRGRAVRLEPSLAESKFNLKETDELHRWAAERSFYLFATSQEARRHRTNWEPTASGWSWNRDFQVRLFSSQVAGEYAAKEAREAREKAGFDKTQEMLRDQQIQAQQQQQQQANQQQVQQQPPAQPAPQAPAKK